jgi:Ni/Co efflux regulator RcnB
MKHLLMSSVTAGVALSMITAPLAVAQSDQHPQGGQQMAPHSNEVHPTGPQHPVQHATVEHTDTTHTMANNTMPHQMTQVSHEEQHPAPPPMHQASYDGHQWHHGDHYTGNRTYVTNYNSYHLSPPPSGYQWVQDGSQFVLIAVASGIIADVILNAAYQ